MMCWSGNELKPVCNDRAGVRCARRKALTRIKATAQYVRAKTPSRITAPIHGVCMRPTDVITWPPAGGRKGDTEVEGGDVQAQGHIHAHGRVALGLAQPRTPAGVRAFRQPGHRSAEPFLVRTRVNFNGFVDGLYEARISMRAQS